MVFRLSKINDFQRELSVLQATPIVGPLVFSPAKAVVSVAQIVYGVARAVFCGVAALSIQCVKNFFEDNEISDLTGFLGKQSLYGLLDQFNGTCSLIYSLSNFWTLGITGFVCERVWFEIKAESHGIS